MNAALTPREQIVVELAAITRTVYADDGKTFSKLIDIPQRTQLWHDWRDGKDLVDQAPRITGTAAGVIEGSNPFKTTHTLWRQMMKLLPPDDLSNPFNGVQRGIDMEDIACELYMLYSGNQMKSVCAEHPDFPWCAVSLDGLDTSAAEILLEIKCLGKKSHGYAQRGILPPYYIPQVQWQLFCTPTVKEAHYWSLDADEVQAIQKRNGSLEEMLLHCKVVVVQRDPAHQQRLFDACKTFRDCLITGKPPAGDAWLEAARQFVLAKEEAEEAEEALKNAQKQLISVVPEAERVDGKKMEGGGAALTFFNKKGALSAEELAKYLGVSSNKTLVTVCTTLGVESKKLDDFSSVDFAAVLKHLGVTAEKLADICKLLNIEEKPYEDFCGKPSLQTRFSVTGEAPAPPPDQQQSLVLTDPGETLTGPAARDYNQW